MTRFIILAASMACLGSVAGCAGEKEGGFVAIFDGKGLDGWKQIGGGGFKLVDGTIESYDGMGLLWYSKKSYKDFILRLEWKVNRKEANSGVFVRFPDPGDDVWVPVEKGHEMQICDTDGPKERTGSVFQSADATRVPTRPVGEWNEMEIKVIGQKYEVKVNAEKVCEHTSDRSLEGYVGVQDHDPTSKVSFRNIRVKELKP